MSGYIYMPIPTQEMLEFCNKWTLGQKKKGKMPYQVLSNKHTGITKYAFRKFNYGVLSAVTVVDKVYILAHGAENGSSFIGASRGGSKIMSSGIEAWGGGTLKKYSPTELAQLLKKEKLPINFVDLRIFSCGSALTPNSEGITASFAQRLASELRSIGYMDIKVTGYLGSVRTSYANRQTNLGDYTASIHKGVEQGHFIVPASRAKVVF